MHSFLVSEEHQLMQHFSSFQNNDASVLVCRKTWAKNWMHGLKPIFPAQSKNGGLMHSQVLFIFIRLSDQILVFVWTIYCIITLAVVFVWAWVAMHHVQCQSEDLQYKWSIRGMAFATVLCVFLNCTIILCYIFIGRR